MTQQERQARSRAKIFEAAMDEFGTQPFEDVTVDAICSRHAISKGMMYHYYTSKEALFLLCVEHTFRALAQYLESRRAALEQQDAEQAIQLYFSARELFFREHERERTVFESAMLRTPVPLREDIARLRAPVAAQNRAFLATVAARLPLRPGLSREDAARYLESLEAVFPSLLQNYETTDVHSMMDVSQKVLNLALFGLARE